MFTLTYSIGEKQFTMVCPTKGPLMLALAEVESFTYIDAWRLRGRTGWEDGSPDSWKFIQSESRSVQILWGSSK